MSLPSRRQLPAAIYHVSPMAAMKFMRHKSIRVTETFYVRYGTAAQPGSALELNFILVQQETTHGAPAPEIAFVQASGTQTLSGYGVTQ